MTDLQVPSLDPTAQVTDLMEALEREKEREFYRYVMPGLVQKHSCTHTRAIDTSITRSAQS